jgi:hypothetical protein
MLREADAEAMDTEIPVQGRRNGFEVREERYADFELGEEGERDGGETGVVERSIIVLLASG